MEKISLIKKICLYYEKNKMKVLWSALGFFSVVLFFALIVTNVGDGEEKKSVETSEIQGAKESESEREEQESTSAAYNFMGTDRASKYKDIAIEYFKNIYVLTDEAALSKICNSTKFIDLDRCYKYNEMVENVDNFMIYETGYTAGDGCIVLYVGFDLYFYQCETAIPMFEPLVIKTKNKNMKVRIPDENKSILYYTYDLKESEGYREMVSIINQQIGFVTESDEKLNELYSEFIHIE